MSTQFFNWDTITIDKKLLQLGKGSKKMRCFKKVSKHKIGIGSLCQPKNSNWFSITRKLYNNFPWAKAVQTWAIFQKVNKLKLGMGSLCQTKFWIESQSHKKLTIPGQRQSKSEQFSKNKQNQNRDG